MDKSRLYFDVSDNNDNFIQKHDIDETGEKSEEKETESVQLI